MASTTVKKKVIWKQLGPVNPQIPVNAKIYHHSICSYYVDVNNKEWIVILLPVQQHVLPCDSYLYNVENDTFIPFIQKYVKDLYQKFNIQDVNLEKRYFGSKTSMSFVIDNAKHVLYWLHSQDSKTLLISIDIKNLQNIKLIDQTTLSHSKNDDDDIKKFDGCKFEGKYTMLVTGNNKIHFVLGAMKRGTSTISEILGNSLNHFEYDVETKELSLLHKNIHLQNNNINHVRKFQFKIQHLLDNLKIGDLIDVKDNFGDWYLAKVLKIKDEQYYNRDNNCNDNCNNGDIVTTMMSESKSPNLVIKSMMIFVHYIKWVDSKWDEWINVTSNIEKHVYDDAKQNNNIAAGFEKIVENTSSLCDCIDICVYKTHKISLARSQSLYCKDLKAFCGLYSKYHKRMIILGTNSRYRHAKSFEGIYCKEINNMTRYECDLIVSGFIRQFENQQSKSNVFNNTKGFYVPKDLHSMILKYYLITSGQDWKHILEKRDQCFDFIADDRFIVINLNNANKNSSLYNNNNDKYINIFVFNRRGNHNKEDHNLIMQDKETFVTRIQIDIETNTYKIEYLANINPPFIKHTYNRYCHVVFCTKSQAVHVFTNQFDKHYSISVESLFN